jgi:hypothetical protein
MKDWQGILGFLLFCGIFLNELYEWVSLPSYSYILPIVFLGWSLLNGVRNRNNP